MWILVLSIIAILSAALAGCANNPFNSYKSTSDQQLSKVYSGNLTSAMEPKKTNDILYNLEYGSLKRLEQNYTASNQHFTKAQNSINNWVYSWKNSTGGELSDTAKSWLINDNANDYQPRGYEKTFLTTYHALNHLDLNNLNDARIEIKRMYEVEQATQNYNQYLYDKEEIEAAKQKPSTTQNYVYQQIMKKYNFQDINSPKVLALKNSYQNAFSHYLAGFVFEALNEPSLARPGYVKAGELNPTNSLIQQSIDNIDKNIRPKTGATDLLIVEETGHAPQIKSNETHIPINLNLSGQSNSCINMINIFYPTLVPDTLNLNIYDYSLDSKMMAPLPMVDVNLMAARTLHDETPHIITRNVTAALRNIAISQAACTDDGSVGTLLSLGNSLGSTLFDVADERTWTFLPAKININRVQLPYGQHTVKINVNGFVHTQKITLNQPYQIITFRVLGSRVIFNPQTSMLK